MTWLLLVTSLPGHQGALRLRVWRSLRVLGAAALRDGVYIAPSVKSASGAFEKQLAEIKAAGGSGSIFTLRDIPANEEEPLLALFDRTEQYQQLASSFAHFLDRLSSLSEVEARRLLRQLQREFRAVEAIDFFRRNDKPSAQSKLEEAERAFVRTFSPDEPIAIEVPIPRNKTTDFRSRLWATRSHLWVDRVCSAWLIRRFIDPEAKFRWLKRAEDCPNKAIGFDFDGAEFTHVGDYVTFEVLLLSFGLEGDIALVKIASLVRVLDVGGNPVPEAPGFEAILSGARERCTTDDDLLADMTQVLNDLYHAFSIPAVTQHTKKSM
jgi:hypothetical protein